MCGEAGPALAVAACAFGLRLTFRYRFARPLPSLPPLAGSVIKGDGTYVAPDDWNLVRSRLSMAKSAAKKKLEAAKLSGTGVAAAQAAFSAADAAYAAHAAKPHARGKSYSAE